MLLLCTKTLKISDYWNQIKIAFWYFFVIDRRNDEGVLKHLRNAPGSRPARSAVSPASGRVNQGGSGPCQYPPHRLCLPQHSEVAKQYTAVTISRKTVHTVIVSRSNVTIQNGTFLFDKTCAGFTCQTQSWIKLTFHMEPSTSCTNMSY